MPETRRRRPALVPTQHGAWGFLLLPVVLGMSAGTVGWATAPTAVAWVLLYPFSWSLTNRLVARRPERFTRALVTWTSTTLPVVAIAVSVRPWLVWIGLAYLPLFAATVLFARAHRERDLANDLILVSTCVLAVPVVAAVGGSDRSWQVPWSAGATAPAALMMLVCALVLVGSTVHVKSLIRERNNPRYTVAAQAVAVVSIPIVLLACLAADANVWLVAPFAFLAGRALFLHRPDWRPIRIGLVELAGLVATATAAAAMVR